MFVSGIGTAVPHTRYTQPQCWTALQQSPQFSQLNSRSHAVLRKVLSGDNGIATRHLAVANLVEAFVLTPDVLHARNTERAASRCMPISKCTFCLRLTED